MRKLWHRLILVMIGICVLSGCVHSNVLEKLGLTIALGFDKSADNKLYVTSALLNPEAGAKEKIKVISSYGNSSKGTRINNNRQLSNSLVSGQIRVAMFGEELSKEGIIEIVENMARDPFFGDMIYLSVSRGTSHELLSIKNTKIMNIGMFMYEMLQQHIKEEWVPSCTMHDFRSDFYSAGKDPMLPIINQHEGGIEIEGLALFHDDHLVGSINPNEAYLLKLLRGKQKARLKELRIKRERLRPYIQESNVLDGEVKVVVSALNSKARIRLLSKEQLEFKVNVKLNVEVEEITELYDFSNPAATVLLQQEIAKSMTEEINRLVQKMQRLNSDAVGFGETYRSSVRHSQLSRDKWHDMFPQAKVEADVKINIVRTGTIE
ncbi:Ger(x)C family spore germination protein [Paenibacillus sp. N1-5-1-14]|uniref:Ger(x)C family spore germination protein n=1 Tax=Paenibacillus radicibacter TaxID=2972488 RepID=UPI0021595573|nr:Ger(x)C family spore germination protein [Paenibacillus radicibacter]MCR8641307.1 Ger(x)C family spore germination protein [Paenibacillus radicibacter]